MIYFRSTSNGVFGQAFKVYMAPTSQVKRITVYSGFVGLIVRIFSKTKKIEITNSNSKPIRVYARKKDYENLKLPSSVTFILTENKNPFNTVKKQPKPSSAKPQPTPTPSTSDSSKSESSKSKLEADEQLNPPSWMDNASYQDLRKRGVTILESSDKPPSTDLKAFYDSIKPGVYFISNGTTDRVIDNVRKNKNELLLIQKKYPELRVLACKTIFSSREARSEEEVEHFGLKIIVKYLIYKKEANFKTERAA